MARGFEITALSAGAVLSVLVAINSEASLTCFADLCTAGWLLLAVVIAFPLGAILGALFIWPFVFHLCTFVQGGPFKRGARVRVLVGSHRDTVTTVYDTWPSRNQVRVELGEDARKTVKDVFDVVQVCKEKEPNQTLHATSGPAAGPSSHEG